MKLQCFLISLFIVTVAPQSQAQRQANLAASILSPSTNSYQQTMRNVQFIIKLKNLGPAPITAADTIGIDVILDGDTLQNVATNSRPFFTRTGLNISAGDSSTIVQNFIYDSGFDGEIVETCFFLVPKNSANLVIDPDLTDNINCVSLNFANPSAVATIPTQDLQVSVFPVPASDFIHISCLQAEELDIVIADLLGRQWINIAGYASNMPVSIAHLPAGVYEVLAKNRKGDAKAVRRFAKL